MDLKNKKVVLITSSLIFFVFAELIYFWLTREIVGADINMVHREIETSDKMFFNGFLGQFFRFRSFGIFNLLIIPFLLKDIFYFRRLKQWQKAFVFMYLMCTILIGLKGFFNPRYALTVFPISICYLIYSIKVLLDTKNLKELSAGLPYYMAGIAILFSLQGIILERVNDTFSQDFTTKQTYKSEKNGPKLSYSGCSNSFFGFRMLGTVFTGNYPNYKMNSEFDKNCPTFSQRRMFDFIDENHKKGGKRFMTNNLPALYYFTDANALYYWAGDDLIFDDQGRRPLFETRRYEDISSYLRDTLDVGFIYTYEPYNRYHEGFHRFLMEKCELLEQNYSTYQIFKINEENGEN